MNSEEIVDLEVDKPKFNVSMTNMKLRMRKSRARRYDQTVRAGTTEATGERIVEAFIARMMKGEWFDEITLDEVAEDAGVTVQTVIRRFGGKEGLLAEGVKLVGVQINATREAPGGDLDAIIGNLIKDYERTGEMILRILALESRYAAIKRVTDYGRSEHRQWVSRAFGAELGALDGARGGRERAIDMLVVVTDVYTWKLLRRDMGHDAAAAKEMMKALVEGALKHISGNLS